MPASKFLQTLFLGFFLFFNVKSFAQVNSKAGYSKEFSIAVDNDIFAFKGTDRYYTNGLFLTYSAAVKTPKASIKKRINEWEIGQKIFTAYKREILAVTEIDRPVAGYLCGKFSQTTFTDKNKTFTWGISAGSTGKLSLAKQVINDFHPFIKVNSDWWGWIWNYQVKDEPGINVHGRYAFSLINKKPGIFQITPVINFTLGTSFTNISQSVLFQVGRFNKMYEGSYWNAAIENKTSVSGTGKKELFFFYQPQIMLQAYDATIQGGMFRNDKGSVTWPVKPFVFANHFGVMYSTKKYSFSFHEIFETKEAKFQFNNHAYGRFQIGYRFR